MSRNQKEIGILLSAEPYSYQKDGKTKQGITISILPADDIAPSKDGDNHGIAPVNQWLPYDRMGDIIKAPAVYLFTTETAPNRQTRALEKRYTGLSYMADILPYTLTNMPDEQLDKTFTPEVMKKINSRNAPAPAASK
jgi:hypothetical protein